MSITSSYNVFCFLLIAVVYVTSTEIVTTTTGPVRGVYIATKTSGVQAYLGIPYAEPPIGKLRFRKPFPIKPWKDVYNATKKPFSCSQNVTQKLYFLPDVENMTENCLHLNLWVPNSLITNKIAKPMAVMVFIHGGAFNLGSSNMNVYDGAELASYGEIIVASMNYRLGVFGFLTAGIEDANGNMGIFDQILALQWIKENVVHFGGDSEKITLFGESSGSMSISLHLLTSMTRNLFKRAIMESGAANSPLSLDATNYQIKSSNSIARIIGCADNHINITTHPQRVVDCLKHVPMETLTRAEEQLKATFPLTFFPHNSNEYLSLKVQEALRKYQYKNTELLIGNNQDEGSIFLAAGLPQYFGMFGHNGPEHISKNLAKSLITGVFQFAKQKNISEIVNFYVKKKENRTTHQLKKAVYDSIGDFLITCSSVFFADFYSRNNSKVYYYVFSHKSNSSPLADWMGTTHFEEIQYVFGNPFDNRSFTDDDKLLSRLIMDRWIAFAKTGNPNIPNAEKWLPYSYNNPVYLKIKVEEEIIKQPINERCEFWRGRFESCFHTSGRICDLKNNLISTAIKNNISMKTVIEIVLSFYLMTRLYLLQG